MNERLSDDEVEQIFDKEEDIIEQAAGGEKAAQAKFAEDLQNKVSEKWKQTSRAAESDSGYTTFLLPANLVETPSSQNVAETPSRTVEKNQSLTVQNIRTIRDTLIGRDIRPMDGKQYIRYIDNVGDLTKGASDAGVKQNSKGKHGKGSKTSKG